jgi:hypothetical protein
LGGHKISAATEFRNIAKLTHKDNRELIEELKIRLNGVAGDTQFGWFTPEPGFLDSNLVDQMLRLGVVSPHFVAAVLAIDLEKPMFSDKRAELLRFVPDRFEFSPLDPSTDPVEMARDSAADRLTQTVIAAIDAAAPAAGTTADEFRSLLKSDNALKELEIRVKAYTKRVDAELAAGDPGRRKAELLRLYRTLVERRQAMGAHPVLGNLDETQGLLLFPLPHDN